MRGAVRIRRTLASAIRPVASSIGHDLVERHYYSPIPETAALPQSTWTDPAPLPGLRLDLEHGIAFLEERLRLYIREFNPRLTPGARGEFHLANMTYGSVDAEVLYAMVRYSQPTRIVELGMGASSLVIREALLRNRVDGHAADYLVADPHPNAAVAGAISDVSRLESSPAQAIARHHFTDLGSGDILFVDTTHIVKTGGDVNYLILEILPLLVPGVVVHFHDVFLPYEYPREWLARYRWFWSEQYLLAAFLSMNEQFDVFIPTHALARTYPERLAHVVPSFDSSVKPGAFWICRVR
jgi:predicted O-methyltransferase YrrM